MRHGAAVAALFNGALLVALPALPEADRPIAVIQYRQNVMKSMGSHMRALQAIANAEVGFDHAAMHSEAIAAAARALPSLFPAGTGPDTARTAARPEAWSDSKGFGAAAAALETKTGRLLTAARGGDRTALRAPFAAVVRACNNCHDQYRLKDN